MSSSIPDQLAREQALHPQHSYIVQAPAGSGKTELLTQRYLVLLAHVQQAPEEIIAITFTRKAAAEMRSRILSALQKARVEPRPDIPHAQKTWDLASQALAKDQALHWNLLDNPNRLRIFTIDSLCASLARQMPVLSGLGGNTKIIEDPALLYQHAARKLLASLETDVTWIQALETLLLHVDNDHAKAERLLVDMLAKRDQWLPYLSASKNARHLFEAALENIRLENIEKIAASVPTDCTTALIELVRFAANNLANQPEASPIIHCQELFTLPTVALDDYPKWIGIAQLLLTQTKQWRKKITQKEGFPAPSSCKDKTEKVLLERMKRRMMQFLEHCAEQEAFRQALQNLLESPPTQYTDKQWTIIDSLLELLPLLAAYLRIEFQLQGGVDYIEMANSALAALGEPESPTDLALALDYRIQHILIDEFQDTSFNQFRLLEQLTAGWMPDDGRTLFLVGDPMQSIYRFRKAEVGLFLRAREVGIGNILLTPLTLSANFRSQQTIIDWVNTTFQTLLPTVEDIATGAVAYHPSSAMQPAQAQSGIDIHPFYTANFEAEALKIVAIIQQTLSLEPQAKIAILVRAKTHLSNIIPALHRANIAYKAVDIDPLLNRQVIQDILALTKALLHFGDRTAWLALLRAPWCGLTLADIHLITGSDHQAAVWDQLLHYQALPLSNAAKQRIARLVNLLTERLTYRRRLPLRRWIEGTWLALGGPACIQNAAELQDTQTLFELLEGVAEGGDIADFEQLYARLGKLYATPNTEQSVQVEIMSIHKAKGLEFDSVILPGLGRELPYDDPQLLVWMERPKQHGGTDLLVAPIRAADEAQDPVYSYLRSEEAKKSHYETGRLLYVAATRAKKQLHLLGHCLIDVTVQPPILLKPAKRSLLAQLWPQIEPDFQANISHATDANGPTVKDHKPNLRRLKLDWQLPNWVSPYRKEQWLTDITHAHTPLPLPAPYRQIHNVLSNKLPSLYHQPLAEQHFTQYFSHALQQQGISSDELAFCVDYLNKIIANIAEDPHAKWLFTPREDSQTTFAITTLVKQQAIQTIIDWVFKDEQQWFVYYNFMPFDKLDKNSFIQQELNRYQACLARIRQLPSALPQRIGIYFPLLKQFIEVA